MPSATFSKDGIQIELLGEDGGCYLRITDDRQEEPLLSKTPLMASTLLAVLSGLRCHVSSGRVLCTIFRDKGNVVLQIEGSDRKYREARIPALEFESALDSVFGIRRYRAYAS